MNIILFDGDCNLCDYSVQFIIKRDNKGLYYFASIQSEAGQMLLRKHHVPAGLDSIILIEGQQCYNKSSAALRICKNLRGGWKLLYGLFIIPKPLRDYAYEIIAKNRYKWFGKNERCMLPTNDSRKRFL